MMMQLATRVPALTSTLAIVYALLLVLMIAPLLLPAICGHVNDSRRFLLGIVLSAFPTAVLFALFPAADPGRLSTSLPLTIRWASPTISRFSSQQHRRSSV
jgi:hypothetical protein